MTPGDSTPEQQEIIRLQQELVGSIADIDRTIGSHMGLIKRPAVDMNHYGKKWMSLGLLKLLRRLR